MSESVTHGPSYEPSSETFPDVLLVSVDSTDDENTHDFRSIEKSDTRIELKPLLDTGMSQAEISRIVKTWNPNELFRGKDNSDRPSAVIQWMLEQTNISVNVSSEKIQRDILAERERRKSRGLPIIKAHKNIADLTPEQIRRLELAKANDTKIAVAKRKVEGLASGGLSNLIELIENLEGEVMKQCPDANIVRLFNEVDDRTGGRDRDLILAKRTLVVLLADDLPGKSSR